LQRLRLAIYGAKMVHKFTTVEESGDARRVDLQQADAALRYYNDAVNSWKLDIFNI